MSWRNNMPARVALATTGLLALVMLLIIGAAYAATALMLREGVDSALLAALPARTAPVGDILTAAARYHEQEDDDDDYSRRHIQVLDPSGVIRFGPQSLPVDREALARAALTGVTFTSVVDNDGHWERRQSPTWWQALTPRKDELRVMYALAGSESERVVVQMVAPLGVAGDVLPRLVVWLAVLGALGTALAGLIAWSMAAQTYRPLRAVIATADDISTRTPALRIPDLWKDHTLRRLVAVLNAMIRRLQEAFETQGRFVAAAAHELRGPLAAMRAELEVALRRERSREEYRTALQGALVETVRLTAVSEHLLTLARYERGAGLVMERDLDLAALLERAAEEVGRSTGGEVLVYCQPGLRVDGDAISLERMVSNLARNGVQAGGAPVEVRAEAADQGVAITVSDRGKGIARADLPHIFEPFYRADPARGRDGGTGLGLTIVRTVVEAHGGRVSVESGPAQGTIFRVWLPRLFCGV